MNTDTVNFMAVRRWCKPSTPRILKPRLKKETLSNPEKIFLQVSPKKKKKKKNALSTASKLKTKEPKAPVFHTSSCF